MLPTLVPPHALVGPGCRNTLFACAVLLSAVQTGGGAAAQAASPAATAPVTDAPPAAAPPAADLSAPVPVSAPAPPPPPAPPSAPAPVSAQPPCEPCGDREDDAEGGGTFLLGVGAFDLAELDDHLVANGYESVGSVITLLGAQGRVVMDSGFVIGGHGAALMAPSGGSTSDFEVDFGGGFGMLDLGFALVHTPSLLLTLTGGIGGYGLSLEIDDERPASFDDVLRNPARSTTLSTGGVLAGLQIGIDGRVPIGEPDKGRRGFFILGARLGALYGPPIGEWSLPNADVRGGPSTQLAGVYATLALGFGGGPAR